jgi:hypothetical protein
MKVLGQPRIQSSVLVHKNCTIPAFVLAPPFPPVISICAKLERGSSFGVQPKDNNSIPACIIRARDHQRAAHLPALNRNRTGERNGRAVQMNPRYIRSGRISTPKIQGGGDRRVRGRTGSVECFAFRRLASTLLEVTNLGHRIGDDESFDSFVSLPIMA